MLLQRCEPGCSFLPNDEQSFISAVCAVAPPQLKTNMLSTLLLYLGIIGAIIFVLLAVAVVVAVIIDDESEDEGRKYSRENRRSPGEPGKTANGRYRKYVPF